MADKYILEVNKITKRFGGIVAADGVSLRVKKGEIISIIGPNGAGKTTVFNMLTGVYMVDEGEILFKGEAIQNKSPIHIVKAGISRTFQNIRLFYDLRVLENVLIGAHIKTKYSFLSAMFRSSVFRREEDEKVLEALRLLQSIGLYERRNDYASDLPYGEQRKLEIARAIATGAELLLLDEPAGGMNPQESADLMAFIKQLQSRGYTILMIEHDMSVVMNISDRVYVLDHGKPVADGLPQEIALHEEVIRAYLGGESHAED